ncbi:hypothetical protein IU500_33935 [Nocardia terpenica]|uniref:hypothetical protein n=1 Tax=Nocardia terpenica TaxID=455432 RepID=UPI001893A39D|nr:hypothetical protein [Nocardia terpenica]MBF6066056.1 hypothetical protein [Nocardia terpenica]MBF6109017.1 hypothetical protein [Nocardia terpenica]MBF6116300.1 hypothetical protein [Nocardia terpenica]MBF6123301.1 hypothetical protein [Nocardia terpenica]MBF6156516.1 hypothetical protein [Nocardia terpenica]
MEGIPPDEYGRGLDKWDQQDRLTRFLTQWIPAWGVLVYHRNSAGRSYPSAVYGPYSEDEARALVERPSTYLKPPGDRFQVGRRIVPWRPGTPPLRTEIVPMDDSDK